MDKRLNIEGSAASRFVQLMRKHGHNKDVTIELATVLTPLPNLSIKLNDDGMVLDRHDLIIAEHLTEHTRTVSATDSDGNSLSKITFKADLKKGDSVIVIGDDDTQFYFVMDKAVM